MLKQYHNRHVWVISLYGIDNYEQTLLHVVMVKQNVTSFLAMHVLICKGTCKKGPLVCIQAQDQVFALHLSFQLSCSD